jgi:hypothetical protein
MENSFQTEQDVPRYESIAELAENVVYRVPGCDDLMIRKTLQEVYRDFCRRSCALRTVRKITFWSDECPIFPVTPDCEVVSISSVSVNGHRLEEGRRYRVTSCHIEFNPRHLWVDECECEIVQVEVPKMGAERAPREFISRYGEYIVSGTLMRLMRMTGKAWSDPQQAQDEAINYENGLNKARLAYYQGSDYANNALRADGESAL